MNYRIFFLSISLLAFTVTQLTFSAASEAKRRRLDSLASPFPTDLYHTAVYAELEELKKKVAHPGCNINIQNPTSLNTGLFGALQRRDQNLNCAEFLLKAGANTNLANTEGETALHKAALLSNVGACQLLISHNANISIKDHNGETAEDMAYRLSLAAPAQYLEDLRISATVSLLNETSLYPDVSMLIASFLKTKR